MSYDTVRIHDSWKDPLSGALSDESFARLRAFVRQEYASESILPAAGSIFRAFDLCPFPDVKVVILGQDPYPTRGHAHGLCFSVEPDVRPFPKSLNNIFAEIKNDLGTDVPSDGNLERWATQGVLLLNAILTVREGAPASHRDRGWEIFSDQVIRTLSQRHDHLVFMLWGAFAIGKSPLIDAEKHLILTAPHPSPLSAYRGFFGSAHFSKANAWLAAHGRNPIVW